MFKTEGLGKIAVLAGGLSSEREISIKSGLAVYNALKRRGCDVEWLEIKNGDIKNEVARVKFDVAFIALHGKIGEDGTIQKLLEGMSRPYTGSGVKASRLALDKIASRRIFKRHKILVPKYKVLGRKSTKLAHILEFPIVVKPRNEGSSIGLSFVKNKNGLKKAFEKAFRYSDEIIAENFIKGRELTVGILGTRPLPVVEIMTKRSFYDFDAKYKDKRTEYRVPASLPPAQYRSAQSMGVSAYRVLNCSDFSRVDMLLGGDGKIYVLEVNTIPGLTERSLLPKAARAGGIEFGELCIRLLRLAIRNRKKKI